MFNIKVMIHKKTTKKESHKKDTKPTVTEEKTIFEWEAVTKAQAEAKDAIKKGGEWLKKFNREDNIHKILWVVLLLIGLRQLRDWILWLILIIFGILFVTGYFEKNSKK